MENKFRVAVCLAAYNGMLWLPVQLESIFTQQDVDVIVYISVDCSTDGTENWINDFSKKDKRIVVLEHGVHFGGAARNFFRLIHEVNFYNFDYVALADQDDIWCSDKLIRAISMLRESSADVYSSNVTAFWSSGKLMLLDKSQPQRKRDFLFEAAGPGCTYVMDVDFVCTLRKNMILHRELLQSVALHDWFIYAWARANGFLWIIDSRSGMFYRQHENNQVGVNYGAHAFFVRVRKVWSGWWFGQAALIASLVGMENDPYGQALRHGRYLWLACHAGQCRRRLRDRIWFVFFCVLMCFKKLNRKT